MSNMKEEPGVRLDIHRAMQMRVCEPVELLDTPETVIKTLIDRNVISPKIRERKLPFKNVEIETPGNGTIRFILDEYRNLEEIVGSLCAMYHLRLETRGKTVVVAA